MILFLIYFYLFIKLFFKVFLLLFKYNLLVFKIVVILISISMSLYIYVYPITRRLTLSKLRKWKYRFPNDYKLITYKDHIVNLSVIFLYVFLCIFGILWLRFRNTDRIIDLKLYYDLLYNVYIYTSMLYIIANTILLLCLFILYKQILNIILKKIKHHFIIQIIYLSNPRPTTASNIYFNIYWKFNHYIHLNKLHNIRDNIRYIFHILNLREYPDRSTFEDDWNFQRRMISTLYDTKIEKIILEFLRKNIEKYKYIIHYILLGLLTLYDLIFNDCILSNTFKIMPYVFVYDIIVKLCKFQDHNIGTTDTTLYEFLYEPWHEITEEEFFFGSASLTKIETAQIIKYYVYPGLQDINHIWTGGNSNKKSKDYIEKTKEIFKDLVINLSSYRNNKIIIFYIWITFLLSIIN